MDISPFNICCLTLRVKSSATDLRPWSAAMLGSPGPGTSTLARRLATLLPTMRLADARETTRIPRVAGLTIGRTALVMTCSFRAPYHTISDVGLIGGGQRPMPGEVSLAHHGILFLDELPEFKRHVLEVLRQPLENGLL
jgi:magnesium chelatase family protein